MQKLRNNMQSFWLVGLVFFVLALLLCLPTTPVHAQSVVPDPVQYIVAPETPGPNALVIIQVQAVGTFLGDATITWSKDGKVVLSGVGERQYSFTTGVLGSQTHIQVKIVSPAQNTIVHDFFFVPSLIDLVWEADTSVPPLYRGKSLYSAGSQLRVVAFPTIVVNGSRVAAKNLSFQWSRGDNPEPDQSGMGRDTFIFSGDQLQPQENVSVDVSYAGTKVGHGELSIPAQNPLLLLYDKDPLRGVLYDTALPNAISLGATEITLEATPYFFSNASLRNGSLLFTWGLNGNEITGPDSAKGQLTLRQTTGGTGAAALSVSLQNNDSDKFVQAAQAAVDIVFGQSNSNFSSFFGL